MVASTRGFALAILIAGSLLAAAQTAAPQVEFDTPDQLQQLVAPIALYPDTLLAEVLAASTYPAEIADAEQFLQRNQNLPPADLAAAVNQQPWDSSVRALTQFPDVLANLSQNLSWTSALGDAYYNQPQDVIDAVQVLRHEAWNAGTLRSTSQQTVSFDGDTIIISPGSAEVVYVPTYNPWVCYGPPLPPFPGYIGYWPGPPGLRFVIVIHILPVFRRWNWGWHSWGFDWGRRVIVFRRAPYVSHSPAFINRRGIYGSATIPAPRRPPARAPARPQQQPRAPAPQPRIPARQPRTAAPQPRAVPRAPLPQPHQPKLPGPAQTYRGFSTAPGQSGTRTGAFAGYDAGGNTSAIAARGRASLANARVAAPPPASRSTVRPPAPRPVRPPKR